MALVEFVGDIFLIGVLKKIMDQVAQHAQEILRLAEPWQQPAAQQHDVEREMSS